VKCWGANNYGQLGDGTNSNRNEPAQVIVGGQPISDVVSISGGYEHTCAVLTNGEAKCWGKNGYGELGDGTTTNRSVPTSVIVNSQPISGIASISGGLRHTCAVTTGGAAKCWGYNALGSLGSGTFTDSLTPVNVDGLGSGVLSIEASKSFATCATVTGSNVKCWGHSWAGNVGDGFTTDRSSPVNVVGLMSSSPSATTLGALTLPGSQYTTTSPNFTLTAPTSNRAGTITFASSNTAVATVDAATGVVQITGTGTAVLAAAIGGNGQYRAASAQVTITVGS
jgi:alpha-tubulin suppressor-like RCC1 family protein